MLYLIGGPPRCGKTTVSQRLQTLLNCSRVPCDYLGTAFSNYLNAEQYPTFPVHGDERYARYSTEEIIRLYKTKAETCWPGIRDYGIYSLYDHHDTVLEGFHIEPRFLPELKHECQQFPFAAAFLIRLDAAEIARDLREHSSSDDWVGRYVRQDVTYDRIAAMIAAYSRYFQAEAARYDCPVFIMDGDFPAHIKQVVEFMKKAIW